MMLDLGDHPARPTTTGPGEEVLDGLLQHLVGREADAAGHILALQRLIEGREGKGRVAADGDDLPSFIALRQPWRFPAPRR